MWNTGDRMRMKPSKDIALEGEMFNWYIQETAAWVHVTGINLHNAAKTIYNIWGSGTSKQMIGGCGDSVIVTGS